ncbi:MAG TPA: hypothetical protein VLG40_03600 [Candidatus Saccharimonas sp.]|nr:hypothetical protein [Candidatus Saccharimonas sp.]
MLSSPNIGYLLAQSAHDWRVQVAASLRPFGITPPQFFMMMSIYQHQLHEPQLATQKQAAAHTAMDLTVASQVVRKLIGMDLAKRDIHPKDSRAYVLSLTQKGMDLADKSSAAVRAVNDRFFAPANVVALSHELQKLVKD